MNILMPQLGETVAEGTIAAWHKKVGDKVSKDEILLDVETDKAAIEVPCPEDGILTSIKVDQGQTVDVGVVLAEINGATSDLDDENDSSSDSKNQIEKNIEEKVVATPTIEKEEKIVPQVTSKSDHAIPNLSKTKNAPTSQSKELTNEKAQPKLSPVVRRLISEHNLDPNVITGSGRDGRITRSDTLSYIENQKGKTPSSSISSASQPDLTAAAAVAAQNISGQSVIPFDRIRRLTAEHMVRSKATSPHVLQAIEVDFSNVDKARLPSSAEWKAKNGFSLTYLPFIARAVCVALKDFPRVNSSVQKNTNDNDALLVHGSINLSIAVAINLETLVAPVIHNAEDLTVSGLSRKIYDISQKARNGALTPDDLSGGTYTLSNNGSFGTLMTAPIINQPQVAIISIDSIKRRPVVLQDESGESLGIRPTGILSQSFDHRAIDGAYSAAFLNKLKTLLESHDWLAEI